ncbi:DUF11 domain-containing protein [Paenibacillus agilis]|uniref:DUF11 domain-containing protein n=1 Tax=Paenibacillus agilis TaxID=3020863 RepID=A0A559J034_9BACL|nr:DUF11 domain-containing protein [Paenibacillus agilis]TVX93230.1 DUF11 domain-containing protein [Paenibacillus agilis]
MAKKKAAVSASTKALTLALDSPIIELTKTVNKTEAKVKDVLTFTVLITNTGTADAQNAILKDLLPKQLKFVPGSVVVDGVPQPSAHVTSGIQLGTVGTEQVTEVTFQAKVVNIPSDEIVKNKASLKYEYESATGSPVSKAEAASNETRTKVIVRPPTNCEKSQATVEFSIVQQEKALQELSNVEVEKIRAANQALYDGKITNAEQQFIVNSKNRADAAFVALSQELLNKRAAIQDLCKGCK